jgi:hypothetical protein
MPGIEHLSVILEIIQMKKIIIFLTILIIPLLSGCDVGVGTGIGFGGDGWWGGPGWGGPFGGVTLFFTSNVDRSTLTPQDIVLINNVKNSARNNGYSVTDTSTADTVSFRATKHIDNVAQNDVDGLPDFVQKDGARFITVNNGSSADSYNIRAKVDLTNPNMLTLAKSTSNSSKITYRMDLPCQVKYTNAQRKLNNGKTLEWDLVPGKQNLIVANFDVQKNKAR